MKRKHNLLILGAIFVVLCLACLALFAQKKHTEKINNTEEEVFKLDPSEVEKVSWTYDGNNLSFEKKEDVWYKSNDEEFPVDQEAMENFLNHFSSVQASFVIEDAEDLEQYGLSSPECTITFTDKDGEETIKMGGYSAMDSKRYITLNEKEVYLIDTDLLEYVQTDIDDFLDNIDLNDYDTLDSFVIKGDNNLKIVYDEESHTYSDYYLYYLVDGEDYRPLSTDSAETFIRTLTDMDLSGYITYKAGEEELTKYGMDSPSLSIKVICSSKDEDDKDLDQSYVVRIGKREGNYYLNMEGSSIIYKIDSEAYDTLKKTTYDDLRPDEVLSLNWDKVSSLDFELDGEKYTVTVSHKKDENVFKLDDKEIDFENASSLIDQMSIDKFQSEASVKKEELSLTVNLEDDKDPQTLKVQIYQYDGDSCVVLFNGETLGLMERSSMADLREALQSIVLNQDK